MDLFGLGVFGDGATIVKTPMMNVLACSAGNPHCVLQVVDCSSQPLSKGREQKREIDPERKHFDPIAIDGATNVQKAGVLINQYFPRQCLSCVEKSAHSLRLKSFAGLQKL
jgi:hypothetical protein